MENSNVETTSPADFVQDTAYATHFHTYQRILKRFFGQDPGRWDFDFPPGALIVDVGCGYGEYMRQLGQRGYTRMVGIEPDATCRENACSAGLDVREGMLTATGLPDAFADAAVVNEVFHHIADYERAAAELSRILKPGGILCFSEPRNTFLRRAMDFLTLDVPLRKIIPAVEIRYQVIVREIETGLYKKFLHEQAAFYAAIDRHFDRQWLEEKHFFQFGRYVKRGVAAPA
jgi:SAM-dependent methyltransferase